VWGIDYGGRCGRRLTGRSRPWQRDSGGGGTAVMGRTIGGGSRRGGRRATRGRIEAHGGDGLLRGP
jgi:hypothetical protein